MSCARWSVMVTASSQHRPMSRGDTSVHRGYGLQALVPVEVRTPDTADLTLELVEKGLPEPDQECIGHVGTGLL